MANIRVVERKVELQATGVLWERQSAMLGAMYMPHSAEARRDEDGVQVRFAENKSIKGVKNAGKRVTSVLSRPRRAHNDAPRWTPWMPVVNGRIESEYMLEFELVLLPSAEGKYKTQTFRAEVESEFNHWIDLTFRCSFTELLEAQRPPPEEPEEPEEEPAEAEESGEEEAAQEPLEAKPEEARTSEEDVEESHTSENELAEPSKYVVLGASKDDKLPSVIPPRYAI